MTKEQLSECIIKGNRVHYDGGIYIPQAIIARRKVNKWSYTAELHDIKSNFRSLVIVPIENISLN